MHNKSDNTHCPLVTLLTPCYNTGNLIHRLLDSVLGQTYSRIEMIVVDDGSTDNSAEVIKSYIPKFESKGYDLRYIYQNNEGQSSAIKHGLKFVNGEFLSWPDSDDWYASDKAIEKMVLNLKQSSSDFAVVRCQQRIVDEVTLKELSINEGNTTEDGGLSLFDNCLFFQNGFYIQPVSYMVKTSALKETTHFDIYTNRHAGQNWQLLLPVFYSYRCIMIKEVLTNILNRATSHSRGQYKKYEDLILKSECFENVAVETVKRIEAMPSEIKKQYIDKLKYNGLRERMAIAYKNRKRKDYANFFHKWAENSNDARCLGNRLTYLAVKLHIEKVWDFCHRYVDK